MSLLLTLVAGALTFGDGVGVGEQESSEPRALPSPAQLMARAAEARFGSKPVPYNAFSLQAESSTGNSSITFLAAKHGSYRFVCSQQRPPQFLPPLEFGGEFYPGVVTSGKEVIAQESGFDGKHAWSRSQNALPSWVAKHLRCTRFDAVEGIHHVISHVLSPWAAQNLLGAYASARTTEAYSFMDVDCYAVELAGVDGRIDRLYAEKESGHICGFTFNVQGKFERDPETWTLLDYADVEGVMLPRRLTLTTSSETAFQVTAASFDVDESELLEAPPRLGEGILDAPFDILDGDRVALRDRRKGKPVLLFFGGSGCAPSYAARKRIEGWLKGHEGALLCYGVDTFSSDEQKIRRLLPRDGKIRAVRDEEGKLAAMCGVAAVPAALLIDKSGIVTALPHPQQRQFWEILEGHVASR